MAEDEGITRRQTRLERYKQDLEDTDGHLQDWMRGSGGYGLAVLAILVALTLAWSAISGLF